jgi:DNA-binding LacI/PurR family transcriptional regulator
VFSSKSDRYRHTIREHNTSVLFKDSGYKSNKVEKDQQIVEEHWIDGEIVMVQTEEEDREWIDASKDVLVVNFEDLIAAG